MQHLSYKSDAIVEKSQELYGAANLKWRAQEISKNNPTQQ